MTHDVCAPPCVGPPSESVCTADAVGPAVDRAARSRRPTRPTAADSRSSSAPGPGRDGAPKRAKDAVGCSPSRPSASSHSWPSTAGVFLGNRITDWMNEPPTRASDEAINVAAPRDAIERRIDVGGVVEHVAPTHRHDQRRHGGRPVARHRRDHLRPTARSSRTPTWSTARPSIRVRLAGETEPREVEPARRWTSATTSRCCGWTATASTAATFADPDSVRLGDEVIAIGFALGLDGDPSVTLGIVSALDRTIGTDGAFLDGLIQTDAAISSGNSGGAARQRRRRGRRHQHRRRPRQFDHGGDQRRLRDLACARRCR